MPFKPPEPGRVITRKHRPTITIVTDHKDDLCSVVDGARWTPHRTGNAVLLRRYCQCEQCDACLVARKIFRLD